MKAQKSKFLAKLYLMTEYPSETRTLQEHVSKIKSAKRRDVGEVIEKNKAFAENWDLLQKIKHQKLAD